ncbi:MAG: hypothetical protein H8E91_05905 [Planctomycetes bacterium]|nr:hypothetical protein [Planctomycetota bacterium]
MKIYGPAKVKTVISRNTAWLFRNVRSHLILAAILVGSFSFAGIHQTAFAIPSENAGTQEVISESNSYYTTIQTIEFNGTRTSFREVIRTQMESVKSLTASGSTYRMELLGSLLREKGENPVGVAVEEVIITQDASGWLHTDVLGLQHSVDVINRSVLWASNNAPKKNHWEMPVLLDLSIGVSEPLTMSFTFEEVDISAAPDTTLVKVKTVPRFIQGKSGPFKCKYESAFVYSKSRDQLYQSASVYTASKGSEKLRIEELTFLVRNGETKPIYDTVDLQDTLKFSETKGVRSMRRTPPPPWVLEALSARDTLVCADKAIAYQRTNWVIFPAVYIANSTYSAVNLGWTIATGSSIATSVTAINPNIGGWVESYEQASLAFSASIGDPVGVGLGSMTSVLEEYGPNGLLYEPTITAVTVAAPISPPKPVTTPPKPVDTLPDRVVHQTPPAVNFGDLLLLAGGGAAIAVGAGGSSGGSGGGGGGSGGAIFASESTNCTLDLCLFRNNEAASGGAVHINSLISSVSQCCFEDNIGGAIRHAGIDATVHECLFAANIYSESGSAIENFSGTMEIHHSNFVENDASGDGDAIFSSDGATTTITDCFFCGNSVDGDASTANYIAPFGDEDLFDLGNQFFTACATCQGDVNGDGVVDLGDMFAVMIASAFGGGDCPEGRYGYVDSGDLLELIDMLICRDRSCEVDCPGG